MGGYRLVLLVLIALAATPWGGSAAAEPPVIVFTRLGPTIGLSGTYRTDGEHGLGVNWIDYDVDGWPDLFAINGDGLSPRLFHNEHDGTFTSADSLLPVIASTNMMGSVFADYDNDGDQDIYVFTDLTPTASSSWPPNLLFRNLWVENGGRALPGQPLFDQIAVAAGVDDAIDPPTQMGSPSSTGGWLDYDRDGNIDLYVCHWRWKFPSPHPYERGRLYHNRGDGTFEDASTLVYPVADATLYRPCLAFVAAHLDSDNYPDLYLGNIQGPSKADEYDVDQIFQNQGGASFIDRVGESPGVGDDSGAAMGITVADIDLDGDWDIYLSDVAGTDGPGANPPYVNPFYVNLGADLSSSDILFAENSADVAGITSIASWGVKFFDADQDGWEDLLVVGKGTAASMFFSNDRDGTFTDLSATAGFSFVGDGRGAGVADYDGDGDLDVAVVYHSGPLYLYRNDTTNSGASLRIRLVAGPSSNRSAIGAIARVTVGANNLMRQLVGGDSAHSQDALEMHFGLGAETSASEVRVEWPSGAVSTMYDVPAGLVVIDELDAAGVCLNVPAGVPVDGCGATTYVCSGAACDGNGACVTDDLVAGSEGACGTCWDCNGLGACAAVASNAIDVDCDSAANGCSDADYCNGAGACVSGDFVAGTDGACRICQDCDGSGACADVATGSTDTGCSAAATACSAMDTCKDGVCRANDLAVGAEGTCGTCQDCNGAGACAYVAAGVKDDGCDGAKTACSSADSCDGLGGCFTNDLAAGSKGTCPACQKCDGQGRCENVPNGTTDVGCNAPATACSTAAVCNVGVCVITNDCGTCQRCNGAGGCIDVAAGSNDDGCEGGATVCSLPDTCDGAGGCLGNDLAAGSEGACPVCQDCDGAGGCADVPDGATDAGCDAARTACSGADSCSGGVCIIDDLAAGADGTCPTCQDCDGAGSCVDVASGGTDDGCDEGATACSTADACDGRGGCLENDLPAGAEGGCAPCLDCDGAGACGDVASGETDAGCAAAAGACSMADTCDGAGACLPNDLAAGAEGACATCEDCDGSGACADVADGAGDEGCDAPGSACSAADSCSAGVCMENDLAAGVEGACAPCQDCDGAGACVDVATGEEDAGCDAASCAGVGCAADCIAGTCVSLAGLGEACAGDGDCAEGHCADGVCCDAPCTGQCEACGADGVCAAVTGPPEGDRAACAGDGGLCGSACDGTSRTACAYPVGQCRAADCADGVAILAATCDGAGQCGSLEMLPCAPFACAGSACADECAGDSGCDADSYCAAGVCLGKKPLGAECGDAVECGGVAPCVDGHCCDAPCDGQCEACDVAEAKGTCTAVSGAPTGARAACASDGSVCTGVCDGSGRTACVYPDASQICGEAECTAGVATAARACDGAGSCAGGDRSACAPYVCGGSECQVDCDDDAGCADGAVCEARACVEAPSHAAGNGAGDAGAGTVEEDAERQAASRDGCASSEPDGLAWAVSLLAAVSIARRRRHDL